MHGKNDPIRAHGGYRELKSFQMSEIVFDATVKFCEHCRGVAGLRHFQQNGT